MCTFLFEVTLTFGKMCVVKPEIPQSLGFPPGRHPVHRRDVLDPVVHRPRHFHYRGRPLLLHQLQEARGQLGVVNAGNTHFSSVVSIIFCLLHYTLRTQRVRIPDLLIVFISQAQQFVLTLKNLQSLNDVPDHVKNYRPKVLVFSGIPAHRQPLVDFANLITKKLSLLICSHIETVSTKQNEYRQRPL